MGDVHNIADKITIEAVNAAIGAFETTLRLGKTEAQRAAVACLTHTFHHREATTLARLMDLIKSEGKDFVRLAPFTLWLVKFAPVKMVTVADKDGKKQRVLQFDKESKLLANPEQTIADATAKLWWTMSRDVEPTAFDVTEMDKRILGIARKALREIEENKAEVSENTLAYVKSIFDQFDRRVTAAKVLANKAA